MRTKLIIAAALAVLLAAAGATLAFANGDGSSGDDNGEAKTFTVFTKTDQQHIVDVAPEGLSLGDQLVFSDVVSETRGGAATGSTGVTCTIVNVSADRKTAANLCDATLSVSAGQISVQGLVTITEGTTAPPFDLPVVGGTGEFEGAGGHVTVEDLSETESKLTFHLLLEE
jgi:hypothetical protein